jgi:hypothetical protein
VYDHNRLILRCLLSDKLASGCGCLGSLDAKRLIHNVVFAHLERAGGESGGRLYLVYASQRLETDDTTIAYLTCVLTDLCYLIQPIFIDARYSPCLRP